MQNCYGDFETASEADIKKVGGWVYASHPSTFPLCFGFMWFGDYFLWKPGCKREITTLLMGLACDDDVLFIFHHAFFDRSIWNVHMVKLGFPELPINRVKCTMAKALAYGLPGKLEDVGEALQLKNRKDTHGKTLLNTLSKPRRQTKKNDEKWWTPESAPRAFQELYDYCLQDIRTMVELDERLKDLSPRETRVWQIDQRINSEGVKLDVHAIRCAQELKEWNERCLLDDFAELTGGNPTTPKQRQRFQVWLNLNGCQVKNTQAVTLRKALPTASPAVQEAIRISQELGKTSLAKLDTMLSRSSSDGILREILQYHGTHTGRWAGRGVQIQNLKRSTYPMDRLVKHIKEWDFDWFEFFYGDVNSALSSAIRGMFVPRSGRKLLIADFAQMEARVLAWLCGFKEKLDLFRAGDDPYIHAASDIYSRPCEEITKDQRFVGKIAELALGYGGGIAAYAKMAKAYEVDLMPIAYPIWLSASAYEREQAERSYLLYGKKFQENQKKGLKKDEEQICREIGYASDIIKQRWRMVNGPVVTYWESLQRSAIQATERRTPVICGATTWFTSDGFLHARLPSGRIQSYPEPRVDSGKLSYMGKDATTGRRTRVGVYGGKLAENITQAVQRDLLSEAMIRLEDRYPVLFDVHDELISEVPFDSDEVELNKYKDLMINGRSWTKGLPVDVDIFYAERYRK